MRLSEIFYWLLNMSITASLCALFVIIIGFIPKIPKRISKHLWIIPFLRMTVPVGLPLKYGLMDVTAKLTRTVAVPFTSDTRLLMMNSVVLTERYVPFTYKTDMIRRIFDVASVVWLTGTVIVLSAVAAIYISTVIRYRDAEHYGGIVYFSSKADFPFLLGIIRPRIILPLSLYGKDNAYIIDHERCHMRCLDNLSRVLAIAVCAVHWFNPLVWLFLKMYIGDMECACDETVIVKYDQKQMKEYASTLLEFSRSRSLTVSCFGSHGLSGRIENILTYRKLSLLSAVCLVLFFAFIFYFLLSNGQALS